jgi:hypothetical protein
VGEGQPLPKAEPRRRASTGGFDIGTLALILLVAVPAGAILRSILGNVGGSVAGAGIVGGAASLFAGTAISELLAQYFPRRSEGPNELPDQPVVL